MGKLRYDLTGQTYGRWTVLERAESLNNKDTCWLCRCQCGNEKIVFGKNLKNGRSKSCGCYKKEVNIQQQIEKNQSRSLDITGERYGKLTAIEPTDQRKGKSIIWKCKCDCGNIVYVSVDSLRGQHSTKSCGCLGRSVGEYNIFQLLENNKIHFISEYHPDDGYGRYDFGILNENNQIIRLIEFDGEQHFQNSSGYWGSSFQEQQIRDKKKNEYALSHNIPLVRIPYWERDKITLDMIMSDKYLIK